MRDKLDDPVLVTGGSGYLGGWVITTLLRRGYRVRTTLRGLARADEVTRAIAREIGEAPDLEFVAADLLADDGWSTAMAGAAYVIHTASPMPTGEYRGTDVIRPAREGTRRVLAAAQSAGVKRVVLTSSGLAAIDARAPRGPVEHIDGTMWTDLDAPGINDYTRAKTLAERDAWTFVADHSGPELATILPGFILGPALSADLGSSMEVIARMLRGKMPAIPRIGLSMVDVRDLAELHVLAMERPAGAGQRLLASGGFRWLVELAATLKQQLGPDADRVSTRRMPDLVLRALALVNDDVRQMVPNLGRQRHLDSNKARQLLGWETRPLETTLVDAAQSLLVQRAPNHRQA